MTEYWNGGKSPKILKDGMTEERKVNQNVKSRKNHHGGYFMQVLPPAQNFHFFNAKITPAHLEFPQVLCTLPKSSRKKQFWQERVLKLKLTL